MSAILDEYRARLREALAKIEELDGELVAMENERSEPVAIIGTACRIPGGGSTPAEFYRSLENGVDAIGEVPPERWELPPLEPSASPVQRAIRWGAFLHDIDLFDAAFFGISPREAAAMDPQQRFLLELTWEAFELAGQLPALLARSNVGVFVGITQTDYYTRCTQRGPDAMEFYDATGNGHCFAAGRLSYSLNLNGPCCAVDTACSSGLVAVHLACQNLLLRRCDIAVAGGVNLMSSSLTTELIAKSQGLSPDGRCKAFDSRANGFVRGEGAGVVVLKRLSDALRDGNPIDALIAGSSINQDGRSAGFAAPNLMSQIAVLKQALAAARISPDDIGYLEAHGTGTPLGDPIEVEALREVFGPRVDDYPCWLGAAKTNIGHLEAAAGIAGLIKIVEIFRNERIPKNLHFRSLNPRITIDGTPLRIPVQTVDWKRGGKARYAGVSSFGMSGTNAHVILQEAPIDESGRKARPSASYYVLPLSAKAPAALEQLAQTYVDWLSHTQDDLQNIAYTACTRRTHHEHRLVAIAHAHQEFAELLSSFARGEPLPGLVHGAPSVHAIPRVVFVFSGQGSQWAGMGRTLLAQEPIFRKVVEEVDALARSHASFSIVQELLATDEESRLHETEVVQPAMFALQVGLARFLMACGATPHAVIGHSVGEIAAAHISGALALEDAVRLVVLRGRIMQKAAGHGKMVWVSLPPEAATRAIVGYEDTLAIAAINDPSSVVLSGEPVTLDAVHTTLVNQGVTTRPLRVDYAFHSPQMDPLARELPAATSEIAAMNGSIVMYSTVTGGRIDGQSLNLDYWSRNIRATVNLAGAASAAMDDGLEVFVEIAPHAVLLANLQQCAAAKKIDARMIPTLRRQRAERQALLETVGMLHIAGVELDWSILYPDGGRVVPLPRYPWQRERHWLDAAPAVTSPTHPRTLDELAGTHPLLGTAIAVATLQGAHLFQRRVRPDSPQYLQDHRVLGEVVFPGSAYFEMFLAAGSQVGGGRPIVLEAVTIEQRLVLNKAGVIVQLIVERDGTVGATARVMSRHDEAEEWVTHATAKIRFEDEMALRRPDSERINDMQNRLARERTSDEHYAQLERTGLSYGPTFRGVGKIWVEPGHALAHIILPEAVSADDAYVIHPALLDACLQTVGAASADVLEGAFLPVGVVRLRLWERPGNVVWVDTCLRDIHANDADDAEVDLRILDDEGKVLAELVGLRIKRLALPAAEDPMNEHLYAIAWRSQPIVEVAQTTAKGTGTWLAFADRDEFGASLIHVMRQRGERCVRVSIGNHFERRGVEHYALDPMNASDYRTLLREVFPAQAVCRGVLFAWSLEMLSWESPTADDRPRDSTLGCISAIHLVQALVRFGWRDVPRLMLITRGAQSVLKRENVAIAQAPVWGLGRTIALEHPELACTRIDLDPEPSPRDTQDVFNEVMMCNGEDQVAFRDGERFVARLVRGADTQLNSMGSSLREVARGRPYQLWQPAPGILERLELRPIMRRQPGLGEVEVETEAAGLNFIDVLMAMGIYPGMKKTGTALGGEFAGRIIALGEGVTNLCVGQEVMGMVLGAFSTHVVVPAAFVVPKPSRLAFEQAASIPAVFMTVQYALRHVGHAQRGEKVLIHSATGGTGLAALQLSRSLGLEVFATAGSEEKREYLRRMGISLVMDSRSLDFAEHVMKATAGVGVDLVLNSLAGEAITKGLEILAPYGRFLELGKKDIYDNRRIGLIPFKKSLSYSAIDLAGMMQDKPVLYSLLLREVATQFENGELEPLPLRVFSASLADEAFRGMAQARHIGKIVITMKDPTARVVCAKVASARIVREDATYLITGGLGGLGLTIAQWLVRNGARYLALVGRNAPSGIALDAMAKLRASGAVVRAFQVDVSKRSDIERVIAEVDAIKPLRGIVHAAGVVDDHSLLELSVDHVRRVFAPKVEGAWNLHSATQEKQLDFFVMYSSSAGLLGSPGQGNYAAANVFLDALAQFRWTMGLPALSIQWGPFSEVGMAAAQENRGGSASARGFDTLTPEEGLEVLNQLLARSVPEAGVMRFDVRRFQEFYPQVAGSPFWSEVVHQARKGAANAGVSRMRSLLDAAAAGERLGLLERHLIEQLGRVLRLPTDRIGSETPFRTLGVDSLMSLEMRNRLESDLGLKLPSTLLFTYPDTVSLAEHLFTLLAAPREHTETPISAVAAPIPLEASRDDAPIPDAGADDFLAAFDASMTALLDKEIE